MQWGPIRILTLFAGLTAMIVQPALGDKSIEKLGSEAQRNSRPQAPVAAREMGDTAEDPFWIYSLPAEVAGNTCPFENDYAEICPYGSYAPDVVYAYTAPRDMVVDISLCDSFYDTQVFIYENEVTYGNPYACNDDWCGGQNYPTYLSHLEDVPFQEDSTYYIVVTGYGNICGDYIMQVEESLGACDLIWPNSAISEGEPDCEDDYVDDYNAGCNSQPESFLVIQPYHQPIQIFGGSGAFLDNGNPERDIDWYQITPYGETNIEFDCRAEFPVKIYLLDGTDGCGDIIEIGTDSAEACDTANIVATIPRGVYWLWVAPAVHYDIPCSANYLLTLTGYFATSTDLPVTAQPTRHLPVLRSYPNPTQRETTIRCEMDRPARVKVSIHDIAGRRIRLLTDGWNPAGALEWAWDGRDDAGRQLPAGIYLLRMESGETRVALKLVLTK